MDFQPLISIVKFIKELATPSKNKQRLRQYSPPSGKNKTEISISVFGTELFKFSRTFAFKETAEEKREGISYSIKYQITDDGQIESKPNNADAYYN